MLCATFKVKRYVMLRIEIKKLKLNKKVVNKTVRN